MCLDRSSESIRHQTWRLMQKKKDRKFERPSAQFAGALRETKTVKIHEGCWVTDRTRHDSSADIFGGPADQY